MSFVCEDYDHFNIVSVSVLSGWFRSTCFPLRRVQFRLRPALRLTKKNACVCCLPARPLLGSDQEPIFGQPSEYEPSTSPHPPFLPPPFLLRLAFNFISFHRTWYQWYPPPHPTVSDSDSQPATVILMCERPKIRDEDQNAVAEDSLCHNFSYSPVRT